MTNLRSSKIAGIAVVDLAAVLILAYAIHATRDTGFFHTLLALLALGIGVHKVLGINTQLGFYLGLNPRVR